MRQVRILKSWTAHTGLYEVTIKFANLILEGLFIMNLYQMKKHSAKFTIWKY